MRALSTTMSPLSSDRFLWLSTAIRDIADIGSPCVPETTTTTRLRGIDMMSCGRMSVLSGMCNSPRLCAISVVVNMLRPRNATFRPISAEMSRICCRRWIELEKQETIMRCSARLKISSKRGITARSLGV